MLRACLSHPPSSTSSSRRLPEHRSRPFFPLLPQLSHRVPLCHLQLVSQQQPHQDLQHHPPAAGLLPLHPERQPPPLRPLRLRLGGGRLQAGAGEGAPHQPAQVHVPEGPGHHDVQLLAAAAPHGAAGGALPLKDRVPTVLLFPHLLPALEARSPFSLVTPRTLILDCPEKGAWAATRPSLASVKSGGEEDVTAGPGGTGFGDREGGGDVCWSQQRGESGASLSLSPR